MASAIRMLALCAALGAGVVLPTLAEPADPGVMLPPAGPTATFSLRGRQYWVQVTALRQYSGIIPEDAITPVLDQVRVRLGARDGGPVSFSVPPSITLTHNRERWSPRLVPEEDGSGTVATFVSTAQTVDWPTEASMTASLLIRNRRQTARVYLRDVRLYTAGPTQ
jgi:hypothetical protein